MPEAARRTVLKLLPLEFNVSFIAGGLAASGIANLWERMSYRTCVALLRGSAPTLD